MNVSSSETSYSQFACIGAGFSGIGLGASLKRWYGITDIRIFDRHTQLGGTWHISKYPGCACDVPSALYSFSFEPNPSWTRILPSSQELWQYLDHVATKYDLKSRMTLGVNVESATWIEARSRWTITYRPVDSDQFYHHESDFLFAGTGQLVTPRELDVPGIERFQGLVMHSARWRGDVDLKGRKIVLFGNGCTAAQIVPSIVHETGHLTQIVRSKHWIMPPIDLQIPGWVRFLLRYVPGLLRLFRFIVFLLAEKALRGFPLTPSAAKFRASRRKMAERYMRQTAPAKYHEILIPDWEVGCKRRIFDSGYLKSLHADNITLTNSKALEILPNSVRTTNGFHEADVLILANGFITNNYLDNIKITGIKGITLSEHWESFGGPEAYNCSAVSGFPNFFLLLGPNSVTGHTSAIMASENSINYALRIIKPVLDGKAKSVNIRREAEKRYSDKIQHALQNTVFSSGCASWYVRSAQGGKEWNAMTYPWSQGYYWYENLFPVWRDWEYDAADNLKKDE
ncbi:hypothetical protein V8F20_012294 [Naviculisporaceae sp. PSN 640]